MGKSNNREHLPDKLSRSKRGKEGNPKRNKQIIGSKHMKKVTAIIETGSDHTFSIYSHGADDLLYGVIGTGNTIAEAKEDFMMAYQEIKESFLEMGKEFEEAEFVFRYDIPSFLQEFAFAFTLAGLERITGINQKQLGHYVSGYRKPSAKTIRKMEEGIHRFSEQLSMIHFTGA